MYFLLSNCYRIIRKSVKELPDLISLSTPLMLVKNPSASACCIAAPLAAAAPLPAPVGRRCIKYDEGQPSHFYIYLLCLLWGYTMSNVGVVCVVY